MARYRRFGYGSRYPEYVPVAQRKAQAQRLARQLTKSGEDLYPVSVTCTKIANTFWGRSWCENLESYSDYANRLPRGRTYVRNGSVVDLKIERGEIRALVSGSDLYRIQITIQPLTSASWKQIRVDCAQSIDSLMSLLQGRFSVDVMQRLTRQVGGLFPRPREIRMTCSCPDSAALCKHLAAVLYGVGARLDNEPQMLFTLRGVDHLELVQEAVSEVNLTAATHSASDSNLVAEDLGALFGIELATNDAGPTQALEAAPEAAPAAGPITPKRRGRKHTGSESAPRAIKKAGRKPLVVVVRKKAGKKKAASKKLATKTSVNNNLVKKKSAKKKSVKRKSVKKKSVKRKSAPRAGTRTQSAQL